MHSELLQIKKEWLSGNEPNWNEINILFGREHDEGPMYCWQLFMKCATTKLKNAGKLGKSDYGLNTIANKLAAHCKEFVEFDPSETDPITGEVIGKISYK